MHADRDDGHVDVGRDESGVTDSDSVRARFSSSANPSSSSTSIPSGSAVEYQLVIVASRSIAS